jgi:uncharacterized protein
VRVRPPLQLATVIVVLAVADVTARYAPGAVGNLAVPTGALVALGLSRWYGATWGELGLARPTWGSGARWGAAAAGIVIVVVAVAAALPLTRSAFADNRYHDDLGAALRYALIAIPLQTVIWEELAFRGVLLALISKPYGRRAGTIGSSVLFGLWHITSALGLTTDNATLGSHLGSGAGGQLLGVLGAVVATTAAGLVFCWLRWRSGSLIAPAALHWALNGAGVLAVAAVWHLTGA